MNKISLLLQKFVFLKALSTTTLCTFVKVVLNNMYIIYHTRLKSASRLLLHSCQDLQISSTKVTPTSFWVNKRLGVYRWHHLQIGSLDMTSPSNQVIRGDVTFRSDNMKWRHLLIGSLEVMSLSDQIIRGDVTFRLGHKRWCHLQIGLLEVTSPSDRVIRGDKTFRLGYWRWRHLQIRSLEVTSPSDRVIRGDISFRSGPLYWTSLRSVKRGPWGFVMGWPTTTTTHHPITFLELKKAN